VHNCRAMRVGVGVGVGVGRTAEAEHALWHMTYDV
jgi:hypothetical protein